MPVVVTRADEGIGPRLVAALRADGAEVRAFAAGDGDVGALRAAGAFVAIGDLDDEGHLDAAMTDAHTVIVPTATWAAEPDVLDATVPVAARAARSAGVRRVVLVSVVGADPASSVPLLAAHGRDEAVVAEEGRRAPAQTLVVRTDGVVGDGLADLVANLDGCDDELFAPVDPARLVAGLVALDAARSGRDDGHAVFTALGEVDTVSGWRTRLAGDDPPSDPAGAGPGPRGSRPTLVGRRWLAPARRSDLRSVLSGRGGPPRAGADLWDFVTQTRS